MSSTGREPVKEIKTPIAPEPLPINPKIILVDLDETLVKLHPKTNKYSLRPGAIELLSGLQELGYELILVTSASKMKVEQCLKEHPTLKAFPKKIYAGEDLNQISQKLLNGEWIEYLEKALPRVGSKISQILEGTIGGKYTPLFNSNKLIDDVSFQEEERGTYSNLGKYGFHCFNPLPKNPGEENGAWADRVIAEILALDSKS